MSIILTAEYKGYVIEHNGIGFIVLLDGETQTRSPRTLEACVEWINRKTKQKVTKVPVLIFGSMFYGDNKVLKEATATSYTDDSVWVTSTETGKREMVRQSLVFIDSPENRKLVEKILAEGRVIATSNECILKLSKELDQFDVSVMAAGVCDSN